MRHKTLIIVHKEFLLDQWVERIRQFVPRASVGRLQGPTVDVDKDIVIGMLQSLSMREYPPHVLSGFGTVIIDECLPYEQCVVTADGPMRIGHLYQKWKTGQLLPDVAAFNHVTQQTEWKPITYAWESTRTELLEFSYGDDDSVLRCTEDHRLLTQTGYVPAKDVHPGDRLICSTGTAHVSAVRRVHYEDGRVYDLEVADHHNFVCCDAHSALPGPVVHNCHHIAAPTFSQAMLRVNAPYRLALSATPTRKDGLTKVLEWFTAPIFFRIERSCQAQVTVEVVQYTTLAYLAGPPTTRFGKVSLPNMVTQLTEDAERNLMIVRGVAELAEQRRRIILLTDRRAHCEHLQRALVARGVSAGLYMGGMSQDQLRASEACTVILGTFSLANEGLDLPFLDTIVLATPKSDVVQAVGRILREASGLGGAEKQPPLVIDINDRWSCLSGQFYKRRAYYVQAGFTLTGEEQDKPKTAAKRTKYMFLSD